MNIGESLILNNRAESITDDAAKLLVNRNIMYLGLGFASCYGLNCFLFKETINSYGEILVPGTLECDYIWR